MSDKRLGLYLMDGLRDDVAEGRHKFFAALVSAFRGRGFAIDLHPDNLDERIASAVRPGYSLFHLQTPLHDKALDLRQAYLKPFWRLERAQWKDTYRNATRAFEPERIKPDAASRFMERMRTRYDIGGPAPRRGGHVFVALQGLLLEQRHGQTMRPVDMVQTVVEHEKSKPIILKLHPKERYSEVELQALLPFESYANVRLSTAPAAELIAGADYVVTQTSSVAFEAMLHAVPSVLFGAADFHHVCLNVADKGAAACLAEAPDFTADYAAYLFWFLQRNCINAVRDGVEGQIIETCRDFGWRV
jgi:hypothetical protein